MKQRIFKCSSDLESGNRTVEDQISNLSNSVSIGLMKSIPETWKGWHSGSSGKTVFRDDSGFRKVLNCQGWVLCNQDHRFNEGFQLFRNQQIYGRGSYCSSFSEWRFGRLSELWIFIRPSEQLVHVQAGTGALSTKPRNPSAQSLERSSYDAEAQSLRTKPG